MPYDRVVDDLTRMFLALSDGTRLRLLALMAGGEVSVGYLAERLGESQPKTSRHLAYLRSSGLVSTRREGKRIYYGIHSQADSRLNDLLRLILAPLSNEEEIVHPATLRNTRKEPLAGDPPAANEENASSDLEIFLL